MPYRDKTGPDGEGPKTGRGLGNCDEKDIEKETDAITKNVLRRHRRFPRKRQPMDGTGPNPGRGIGVGGTRQYRNR